jgi:hypothetical protein
VLTPRGAELVLQVVDGKAVCLKNYMTSPEAPCGSQMKKAKELGMTADLCLMLQTAPSYWMLRFQSRSYLRFLYFSRLRGDRSDKECFRFAKKIRIES